MILFIISSLIIFILVWFLLHFYRGVRNNKDTFFEAIVYIFVFGILFPLFYLLLLAQNTILVDFVSELFATNIDEIWLPSIFFSTAYLLIFERYIPRHHLYNESIQDLYP